MRSFIGVVCLALVLAASTARADVPSGVTVSDLQVTGRIDGENVTFTLSFNADVKQRGTELPLVCGDVAYLGDAFPRDTELVRRGKQMLLRFDARGKQKVSFEFASVPRRDGDWRQTSFAIPDANVRKLTMLCDRDDLEVAFPGALKVDRNATNGSASVTAYLGVADQFQVRWKPQVRQLDAELVVACDANSIAVARVGALKLDTIFTYRVVQGALNKVSLALPAGLNITQVSGADIREWRIDEDAAKGRTLLVTLSRPQEERYLLRVESELVLPEFPCAFDLPALRPMDVIRTSGFLMMGTDSAIKLLVNKAMGLTQVDQSAFPAVMLKPDQPRPLPARSAYAYQYANMPYTLELSANDIVTAFTSEERLTLSLRDNDLVLQAAVELDVRDAPARDIAIETDPGWIVANVSGANVSDYDVRDEKDHRVTRVFFRDAVLGRTLVNVRLERSLGKQDSAFTAPSFHVRDARSERGYIVVGAEKGIQLKASKADGLREVNTGSLPTRVPDAQQAFRFKAGDWSLALAVDAATPAIHSEVFHLVSIGEGAAYGSCTITYHISGAPVRNLKVSVPESFQNVEFVGRDIRGRERDGRVWTIALQDKIMGDYTLLVTYDHPFKYEGDALDAGAVETIGTGTESGYIVVAGAASLYADGAGAMDPSMIRIDRAEIPQAYALLVNDPVLEAYKYVRSPHVAHLALKRYATRPLLSQVADHTTLSTRISDEGEVVTKAMYYVKNTSDQHLGVTLPAGAKLWSAAVDGATVQALDTSGDGRILVPLPRHRDPNQPSRVEIVYAESHGKLGILGGLRMSAPVTAAQSVFARWSLTLPQGLTISRAGGNMMADTALPEVGIRALVARLFDIVTGVVMYSPQFLFFAAAFVAMLCGAMYNAARGRGTLGYAGLAGIAGLIALVFAPYRILTATPLRHIVQDVTFTKTVSLADSALRLDLRIVPNWIGTSGSLVALVLGVVAGAFLVARAPRGLSLVSGLTLLIWGLAQTEVTLAILTSAILVAVPFMVVVTLVRACRAAGRRYVERYPPPTAAAVPATAGFAQMRVLVFLALATTSIATILPPVKPEPVMKSVTIDVDAPGTGKRDGKIAKVHAILEFELEEPGSFRVLSPGSVLTGDKLGSDYLSLKNLPEGYRLYANRAGTYRVELNYLVEVVEMDSTWRIGLDLPQTLKNKVTLRLPQKGLDVSSPDSVLLKTQEKDTATETTIVFGPVARATLAWKPQERKTKLEESVFFCEVNTFAAFEPGVVNLTHLMRYQIAQGEIQTFTMKIPDGMSVTAVRADGLGTWRFDPETRELEALLEKPVTGDFLLTVVTQVAQEGLPYQVTIAVPAVTNAARQRGAIAIAAPDNVQVRVDTSEGLSPMNIGDFAADAAGAAAAAHRLGRPAAIKRTFRYHQLPATASVQAEQVTPEIRVTETAQLDISDERIALSSQLAIGVAKAGIFSVRIGIPESYDVESLTGPDVSHWDEIRDGGHAVVVHFRNQVSGDTSVNLSLARTEKGIEETVAVPTVRVADAMKHAGTLAVSGERGVRFTTVKRDGVSEINPKDLGIESPGYLAFRLLRPDWLVELKTEVVHAAVKADVLQRVDVSEGLLQGHCFIRYKIDGAGVKSFQLQAPQPGVTLTLQGRDIAQVQEIDKTNGIWQVDLHNKVIDAYALEASYQAPFNPDAHEAAVAPLRALNTDGQRGYLVVMAGGRLQVKPSSVSEGLKEEDARAIPSELGAGDLSNAILCYRSTHADYALTLSIIRHGSADVLPATVDHVLLTSVVSEDDQMITRVAMDLRVGDLRFLKTELPEGSQVWSTFVNGKPVTPLVEKSALLIPLDPAATVASTSVELIYSGGARGGMLTRRHLFTGPRFDLPLTDIAWSFYLPPRYSYHGFGGTLKRAENQAPELLCFNADDYEASARLDVANKLQLAENVLKEGEELAKQGRQREARKAFESALYFSQSKADFNEDARIQYRNLAKQQAIVGLVNRRASLKTERNVLDTPATAVPAGVEEGQWTADYGRQVQQSLTAADNDSLGIVAEKLIDQQAAASAPVSAIQVTVPLQGVRLDFHRALQINPLSEMSVTLKASGGAVTRALMSAGALAAVFAGCWLMTRAARPTRFA